MPLARRIARTYYAPLHREDIEQVAYLALVKAADRFDRRRGHAFVTFAIPTIKGEIRHYLRDHSWDVHVPRLLQDRAVQAQRVSDALSVELGRPPTTEELAARLGVRAEAAREALGAVVARDARSLDAPPEAQPSRRCRPTSHPPCSEDDDLGRALDRATLRAALDLLSDQERQAVALRYFADLTQSEIACQIGISQMQVSRVLRRALNRMAHVSGDGHALALSNGHLA